MRPWGGDTPEHDGFQTGNCAYNEISVMREWGISGGKGRALINIYGNLREASSAADMFRNRAMKRGYARG